MSKRRMQWMGITGLAGILLVAGLVLVDTPAARSQGEGAPTIYTFVSEFQIPRASWAQYSEDTEKGFVPVADKLVADGTILGYTTFETIVHTSEGYTHGAAWQSHSIAGLMKVLDEVRKSGPQKGQLAATKHEDLLLQSNMYAAGTGGSSKTTSGYVRVVCQMAKADRPDDYVAGIKKHLWPTFEDQLKKGSAVYVGMDSMYVNTGAPSMRCLVISYPSADGMDKWATAVGATLGKLTGADREAVFGSVVPDSRRDLLARITHAAHK
jgi:hypothetical protein